ncbi:MAG: cysteine-rich small domain-containing protein [Clostridium sp.]|nr:cysteine-rich small domain-containing protein [Acetatifactor muris]MCM1527241.1 cysteine-rich small domain-containing protein [Bacteroides sp.]MCM1563064.1 cysteine-rich small domain-containing protein [Clostridium sp.]
MENSYRFFANRDCQYFPCHKGLEELNCLFCYCPFYLREDCPGDPQYLERGEGEGFKRIKNCADCTFPHRPENYDRIIQLLKG